VLSLEQETKNEDESKNVVEPDITIVCDKSLLDEKGCKGTPDMIIEIVSPSTGRIDKMEKFNKYEQAGVKEYWIVEPQEKMVSVFTIQENGRYGRPALYTVQDNVKVTIFENLSIELSMVFD
jgi:Uma2 family endonuclease